MSRSEAVRAFTGWAAYAGFDEDVAGALTPGLYADLVVLAPHLVDYAFVRYLKRRDIKIIELPVEEYWDLAVNGVTLEPGKVILNAGAPQTVNALEREGVEVIQVDFSESHKFAIAGLHCATLELVRDQPGPLLS